MRRRSGNSYHRSRFSRFLKRAVWGLLLLLALVLAAGSLVAWYSGDAIRKYAVSEINKHLTTPIEVGKISFSVLRDFPFASVRLQHIRALEAVSGPKNKTLLEAQYVSLQFNLLDILNKRYQLRRIEVGHGRLNAVVLKDGRDNYHFWKTGSDTARTDFLVELKKLIFKDMLVSYQNAASSQDYLFLAKEAVLKGRFSDEQFSMLIKGDMSIRKLQSNQAVFFENKEARIDLDLDINNLQNLYHIRKGALTLQNMDFMVSGNVVYNDRKKLVDLEITGTESGLSDYLKEVPAQYRKVLEGYKTGGKVTLRTLIKGSFLGEDLPAVSAYFSLKEGEIRAPKSRITLDALEFDGLFTSGRNGNFSTGTLTIHHLKGKLKEGTLGGDIRITGFDNPKLEVIATANLNLSDLQDFIKTEPFRDLSGNLAANISFSGSINDLQEFTVADFMAGHTNGKMTFTNVNTKLGKSPQELTGLNGSVEFTGNDVIISRLAGEYAGSGFELKGSLRNFLPYMLQKNEILLADVSLSSKNLSLDRLLQGGASSNDTVYQLVMPEKMNLNLTLYFDQMSFRKFRASSVRGNFSLKDRKLFISPLAFKAMDGTVMAEGLLDASQLGRITIQCDATLNRVDVRRLFHEMENFGQDNLKAENLTGDLTADIQFTSVWNEHLRPDLNKLSASADVTIEDGELIDYKPVYGLSRFLKLEDLSKIRFSTLKNHIDIRDRRILIPDMVINSSAVNLGFSGTHNFNNEIDYRLRLLLSELMSKKARKVKKENEEFGVVTEDGLGKTTLFIHVTGTVDKPVYAYDAKGVKNKIILDIAKEKSNLKNILREEFGWLKKDTTRTGKRAKEEIPPSKKFEIEWEEDSTLK